MATVSYIPYRAQNKSVLRSVIQYVGRDDKTASQRFVSGIHCTPQLAYHEFAATREMHRKQSPVWFYHYTQSFSPEEHITPELAHELAGEFAAKAWPESEVLVATHVDREHIHTHFVVNAVCHKSGKMLRQGPDTLFKLRKISDELCRIYGLSVLKDAPKHGDGMSSREYRSAVKGESWKFQLINTIDLCMRRSKTKKEFIENMEQLGYGVRWEENRQNITYTHPSGRKVRDEKLHSKKYLKARMEHEFRIRNEIISGRLKEAQYADAGASPDACTDAAGHSAVLDAGSDRTYGTSAEHLDGVLCKADGLSAQDLRETCLLPDADTDGRTAETVEAYGNDDRTGWEAERAEAFAEASVTQTASAEMEWAGSDFTGDGFDCGSLASAVSLLGRRLEQSQDTVPVNDSTMHPGHIDRKRWKKLQEKRIALGHKEDDHEEYQGPSMSM